MTRAGEGGTAVFSFEFSIDYVRSEPVTGKVGRFFLHVLWSQVTMERAIFLYSISEKLSIERADVLV